MAWVYSGPMSEAGRGADFLQLSPAAAPARGLTSWLADGIRAAIIDGRLGTGTSLPATRLLADDLGVSRGVVVAVDQHGLQTRRLSGSGLRAALLTPAHQFPTGLVLAPERRRELLDWAVAADAVIIEDDYDAEYRYDRAPVPALQTAAPGHVAYAGTTSKTLAPGMRLGWLVPPARLHADLVAAKHAADLGSPALPQLVLARLIATGELEQ